MLAPNTSGDFLPGALCPKAPKSYSFLCKTKRRIIGTHNKLVNDDGGFRELLRGTAAVPFLLFDLFREMALQAW